MNPYVEKLEGRVSSPDVKPELVQPPKSDNNKGEGAPRINHSRPAVSLVGNGQVNFRRSQCSFVWAFLILLLRQF